MAEATLRAPSTLTYPKTENLWVRDPETHLMAPENGVRMEEVGLVDKWLVLEKIDGMNIRVVWSPGDGGIQPRIYGRTDRAQIPGDLMERMQSYFTYEKLMSVFSYYKELEDGITGHFRPEHVVLFGEGYGPGIQQGGHYRDDKDFALFDVVVDGKWLRWSGVEDVARKLGISTVPVLSYDANQEEVEYIVKLQGAGKVNFGWTEKPEGVIARTDPYLFDGRGRRVMFKHKVRDVVKYLETTDGFGPHPGGCLCGGATCAADDQLAESA